MAGRLRSQPRRMVGAVFDPAALAIFAAFATPPTGQRRLQINALVTSLKVAGVWPLLDVLQVYAAADAQAALVNWARPGTYTASLANDPTFEADIGVLGDGTVAYIDTGFNPVQASNPNFTRDAGCFGAFITNAFTGTYTMGTAGGTVNRIAALNGRINSTTFTANSIATSDTGLMAINRSAADAVQHYLNGALAGTGSEASTNPSDTVFSVLRSNNTYSNRRAAGAFIGGNMTAGQHAALHAALRTYLVAVGAAS